MRQVQVHGGATSKARASHEPFKEATEASAWGKAGVATGAAPGGLPGGVLGKESGVARGRFTCSLSEDLRPAANRGAIASSGPKVAAVDIASRHRGGEGLGLDYEVADAHKCASETVFTHTGQQAPADAKGFLRTNPNYTWFPPGFARLALLHSPLRSL